MTRTPFALAALALTLAGCGATASPPTSTGPDAGSLDGGAEASVDVGADVPMRGCPGSPPGSWMAMQGMVCGGACVEQNNDHCGSCDIRCIVGQQHCCQGLLPDVPFNAWVCCPGP